MPATWAVSTPFSAANLRALGETGALAATVPVTELAEAPGVAAAVTSMAGEPCRATGSATAFAGSVAGDVGSAPEAADAPAPEGAYSEKDSPGSPMTITLVRQGISSLSLKKQARTVPSTLASSSKDALSVS